VSGVDLVTFLRERLDEMADEARQLTEALAGSIPSSAPFALAVGMKVSDAIAQRYNLMSRYRMDPQFVLDDVAAKRRIVDWAMALLETLPNDPAAALMFQQAGDELLRQLAAPFARHPDFDPAWSVEA
jgi:hypothetical protein